MTEGIFAVLYVSIMGLTGVYKTTVFLHLFKYLLDKFWINQDIICNYQADITGIVKLKKNS